MLHPRVASPNAGYYAKTHNFLLAERKYKYLCSLLCRFAAVLDKKPHTSQ